MHIFKPGNEYNKGNTNAGKLEEERKKGRKEIGNKTIVTKINQY